MIGKRQVLAVWGVVAAAAGLMLVQALLPGVAMAPPPPGVGLDARLAALEAKLACVTTTGVAGVDMDVFFEGCNVHIRNGAAAGPSLGCPRTCTMNSLGNLIIGYNEDTAAGRDRGGSHNLVIGPIHEYSSAGGFVAGSGNTIRELHASVTGGGGNVASGRAASVSGGINNQATNNNASVSGGAENLASGENSSVSGGQANEATAFGASVSGGQANVASNGRASVSGGQNNEASGFAASVSGGNGCTASGTDDWMTGAACP